MAMENSETSRLSRVGGVLTVIGLVALLWGVVQLLALPGVGLVFLVFALGPMAVGLGFASVGMSLDGLVTVPGVAALSLTRRHRVLLRVGGSLAVATGILIAGNMGVLGGVSMLFYWSFMLGSSIWYLLPFGLALALVGWAVADARGWLGSGDRANPGAVTRAGRWLVAITGREASGVTRGILFALGMVPLGVGLTVVYDSMTAGSGGLGIALSYVWGMVLVSAGVGTVALAVALAGPRSRFPLLNVSVDRYPRTFLVVGAGLLALSGWLVVLAVVARLPGLSLTLVVGQYGSVALVAGLCWHVGGWVADRLADGRPRSAGQ